MVSRGYSFLVFPSNNISPDHILYNPAIRLDIVDFYSNTHIRGKYMGSYNNRLILANVTRSIFEGFSFFLPIVSNTSTDEDTYSFYVTIKTDDGNKVIRKEFKANVMQGYYFFYPDTRAQSVAIYKNGYLLREMQLKESKGFGGAWVIPDLYYNNFNELSTDREKPKPDYHEPEPENLKNILLFTM